MSKLQNLTCRDLRARKQRRQYRTPTNILTGHGDTDSRQEPQQVLSLPFTEIVHVSAAHSHTSMVSSDGEVYMCGSGSKGQLGTGSNSDSSTPVALDVSDSAKMVSIRHAYITMG